MLFKLVIKLIFCTNMLLSYNMIGSGPGNITMWLESIYSAKGVGPFISVSHNPLGS